MASHAAGANEADGVSTLTRAPPWTGAAIPTQTAFMAKDDGPPSALNRCVPPMGLLD
jgi:hypothetical protein